MNRELENWQERSVEEMRIEHWYAITERDDERALRRRLVRRAALETLGALLALALLAVVGYLFLAATPSQWSAEADAAAEEIERVSGN